MGDVMGLSRST